MSRKQQIIETALELFNESGTKAITTNHIAANMGISAGNLYYHFRNKEEIIREIFYMMDKVGLEEYGKIISSHPEGSLEAIEHTFIMIQNFNWRFRFFKRELPALLMNDTLLHNEYANVHNTMLNITKSSIKASIEHGLFVDMTEDELSCFSEEIWLITLFWLNYLEAGKEEVNETTIKRGNNVLMNSMKYRLTEKGKKSFKTLS